MFKLLMNKLYSAEMKIIYESAIYIYICNTNTLRKGMNASVMSKQKRRLGSLTLLWQPI